MPLSERRARSGFRRRGSMYMVVLGCTMVVAAIGLATMAAARLKLNNINLHSDFAQAHIHARSAVEWALQTINTDRSWRTIYAGGVLTTAKPIGTGSLTVNIVDPVDGMIANGVNDPIVLTGIGFQNDTRYDLQVDLVARPRPLSALEVALQTGSDLTIVNATVSGAQTIASNASITAVGSTINLNAEAVGTITGSGFAGTTVSGITPRFMPDVNTVFDYYLANGTTINVTTLPIGPSGNPVLSNVLLSRSSNPYGSTNLEGIYVINCLGQKITIKNCRIVGTILLLQPGVGSALLGSIHWEPAVANYPALLVSGDFDFGFDSAQPLTEGGMGGVNFNPRFTPYQGMWDIDMMDTYPTVVRGLVYVSGSASSLVGGHPTFDGVVLIGAGMTLAGPFDLSYRSLFFDNPPPGFLDVPEMVVSPGSWRHVVN